MEKKVSKSIFSSDFTKAIVWELNSQSLNNDKCVTSAEVARQLLRSNEFAEQHPDLLRLAVTRAVHNGSVPGYRTKRGAGGGIERIKNK